ncbi:MULTISPECIES: HAD family hydrolase [Marinobacter]|uniref:HAD family hydrolase n=1 Tax=Marinobacter TaxID=2742 RepID=UPI001249057E|nr:MULTISPECIES: HAD family hydrolase [Marinobacter]MBL3556987.1 glycosyltransferase [Marinobacter sp. JB05H06]
MGMPQTGTEYDGALDHKVLNRAWPRDGRHRSEPAPNGVIMHIALQGCLKAGPIPYGLTADTGGHIRYLLELVEALARRPEVSHQIIVTRAFDAPHLGDEYRRLEEQLSPEVTLWRCQGATSDYLPKEALWREVPQMVDSLMERMRQQGVRPALIHAHYADAGVMAMRLKSALGIPYVFTAHSLGATKAQHMPSRGGANKELRRRRRLEEVALKGADSVIASSEHEARFQYGLYLHHNLRKTRVNPPGCDLEAFSAPAPAEVCRQVDAELQRFLRRPHLPCLLAIARPVEKKNLCALVKAYGENPRLREQANLVIYAGTRKDIDSGEAESRQVWNQLLRLIDKYDLYGDVAYPKHHDLSHVPAIYQWAAQRHGVFVNPALNEPFGLTLLEAAAAGLPVVATQEGGPVDIVRRCQHGLLVPPTDTQAIADACHHLLEDDLAWKRLSARGRRNVNFYSWTRHARQYVENNGFSPPQTPSNVRKTTSFNQLLATDMDGTLLGHHHGLAQLKSWIHRNRQCLFVIATGRSVHDALCELDSWGAPRPDVLIADVGSSVYEFDPRGAPRLVEDWHPMLQEGWQRAQCQRLLDAHWALVPQGRPAQSTYKLSYFISERLLAKSGLDTWSLVKELEQALSAAGLSARVVCSHGNLLDVLPSKGGKARAVNFLRRKYGIEPSRVVSAGDSGNDLDLLRNAAFGIAVANHTAELAPLRGRSNIYWARAESAAGILEGLYYRNRIFESQPGAELAEPLQGHPAHAYTQHPPSGASLKDGPTEIEAGA